MKGRIVAACLLWQAWKIYRNPDVRKTLKRSDKGGFCYGRKQFSEYSRSTFKGMDSFITTKTVVGDAITVGDTIILPLVDVSFGVGAGAFAEGNKNNGAGGMGGKISPSAVLVINKNGAEVGKCKESGCNHQDPRHGSGSGR